MNKRHEILPVILGIVTAFALLIVAVLLFSDAIMRTFAPKIYVGGRLLNTYNELEKEADAKDSFFSGGFLPSDNMDVTFKGSVGTLEADFSGQYSKENPSMYFSGAVTTPLGTYNTQLFSENGESGICLSDYIDAWFCAPNDIFLKKLDESGFARATGISIPQAAIFPQTGERNNNYMKDLYPVISRLLDNIKIDGYSKKDNGISEYKIYVKGQAVKQTLSEIPGIIINNGKIAVYLSSLWGDKEFIFNASDGLSQYIEGLTFPDTIAFSVYERKKCIVSVSSDFTVSAGSVRLWVDMSQKARLYDFVDGGILYTLDSTAYGVSYRSNGNHFYRNENLSDNTKIEIALPLIGKTKIEKDIKFTDLYAFTYSLNASNDILFNVQAKGEGTHSNDKLTLESDNVNITLDDKDYSINSKITFQPAKSDLSIPSKEKYSIDSLSLTDFIKKLLR